MPFCSGPIVNAASRHRLDFGSPVGSWKNRQHGQITHEIHSRHPILHYAHVRGRFSHHVRITLFAAMPVTFNVNGESNNATLREPPYEKQVIRPRRIATEDVFFEKQKTNIRFVRHFAFDVYQKKRWKKDENEDQNIFTIFIIFIIFITIFIIIFIIFIIIFNVSSSLSSSSSSSSSS